LCAGAYRPQIEDDSQDAASRMKMAEAYEAHKQQLNEWRRSLGPFVGQASEVDGKPVMAENRFGIQTGYASRAALIHRIEYLSLHREVDGIAAIADWLCRQDCVDLQYRFTEPQPDYRDHEE
jgi:hypothetical protein